MVEVSTIVTDCELNFEACYMLLGHACFLAEIRNVNELENGGLFDDGSVNGLSW